MNFFDILFIVLFAMFVLKVIHFFLTWLVGLYFLSELYPDDDARNRTETLAPRRLPWTRPPLERRSISPKPHFRSALLS